VEVKYVLTLGPDNIIVGYSRNKAEAQRSLRKNGYKGSDTLFSKPDDRGVNEWIEIIELEHISEVDWF
jgi:hypothetical protein